MNEPKLDESKLTPDQLDKLEKWKNDVKSLQTLEDIATMAQEMLGIMDDQKKDPGRKTLIIDHVTGDDFVKILKNMQDSLEAFKEQKEPTLPDYSKPVVEAVSKLERALSTGIKELDVKPQIKVAAPSVNVDTPTVRVDLKGVEKAVKDIPKAFGKAIASIPKPEKPDNSELVDLWEGISEQLVSLENATRLKPQPGKMAISGPFGQDVKANSLSVTTASDQDYLDLPFSTDVTVGAQVLLNNTNVSAYSSLELVWTAVGTGLAATVQFAPIAGGTYIGNVSFVNRGSNTAAPASSGVAANTIYEGPVINPFMRLNITALTTGPATGFIRLHKRPMSYHTTVVNLNVGTTGPVKAEDVASATGDLGIAAMGIRRDTPVANDNVSADADYTTFKTDNFGMMWVNDQTSPVGTLLNTYATRITTNTTTTPTAVTSYISSIAITTEVGGTTSTVTIRDKQGTPQVLVNGLATTAASLTPTVINFQTPVKMTSGIDIVTAGAVAGTVDIWIDYYQ